MSISRWSYNRLIETIQSKALQLGITVESGFQQIRGDPKEQAKHLAIEHDRLRSLD